MAVFRYFSHNDFVGETVVTLKADSFFEKRDKYCIHTSLKMTHQNHQTDSAKDTIDPLDSGFLVDGRPASGIPQQIISYSL